MVKFMSFEDDYFDICETMGYKTVIYGAGMYARKAFPYLKNISWICDRRADEIGTLNGVPVIPPAKLQMTEETLLIVICVKSEVVRKEIRETLEKMSINACVFDFFNNVAFRHFTKRILVASEEKKDIRYVHLVCEDRGWILRKFAVRMQEELERKGYECSISNVTDSTADINHYIIYDSYEPIASYNDTIMITHIDSYNKLEMLKFQLGTAKMGICMSRETMERLVMYGVPREKLCYINPAQDEIIKPKKYVLGITNKTHDDHRKNENVLVDLCKVLSPDYFAFKIMGSGWTNIVAEVKAMGFQIDYYDEFDYEEYIKLIPTLDYFLYWGFDEGSMGYLDALRAGVGTIVTPQGFHLDLREGITYECRTIPDFRDVLLSLQRKRERIVNSVSTWTWKNYVNKHLEVWNYLLGNEENIYKNQHMYEDGIFSVLRYDA